MTDTQEVTGLLAHTSFWASAAFVLRLFHVSNCARALFILQERPLLDGEMRNLGGEFMPPREDESDTIFEYLVSDTGECISHCL